MKKDDWSGPADQVQKLALSGFASDRSLYVVLAVDDAAGTRAFLSRLQQQVSFDHQKHLDGLSIGLTFGGLRALGAPLALIDALRDRTPAFCQGARSRALERLGDAGASAPEHWDPPFAQDRAEVVITLHGDDADALRAKARRLEVDAAGALDGWADADFIAAAHLDRRDSIGIGRRVHFGLLDNLSTQRIADCKAGFHQHLAGELLVGHPDDDDVDRWAAGGRVSAEVRDFVVNGSFAALRVIQQHVKEFEDFLERQVAILQRQGVRATKDWLRAKLCGRWHSGQLLRPKAKLPAPGSLPEFEFDFAADPLGQGCPFGAHIRRTHPRSDRVIPPQLRPLFRRGMPYGPAFDTSNSSQTPPPDRGLVGLFFCASLEEQFEVVMSEWVEKSPMVPGARGRVRDPLIGNHDDPDAGFHIPVGGGRADLVLTGFDRPFVRTRGTLYAFYPSRSALTQIGSWTHGRQREPASSKPGPAPARMRGAARQDRAPPQTDEKDTALRDRYCDLVMEGGVTNGVIYTRAVTRLAARYRFQSIGGTSIGAFAAALAAAAEFARRHGSMSGFDQLERLPGHLGKEDHGRTLLLRLFRPQRGMERLFAIFLATIGRDSGLSALAAGLREAWRRYVQPTWFVVLLVVVAWIVLTLPWWLRACPVLPCDASWRWDAPALLGLSLSGLALAAMLLPALLLAFVGKMLWGLARDLCAVPANGFGLCRGGDPGEVDGVPDLAVFLHETLQRVAGLGPNDPPLTFAHLWRAPDGPSKVLSDPGQGARHSIDLVLYATNLTHARPFRFPLDDQDPGERLFFRRADLAPYFPGTVLDALEKAASRFDPHSDPSGPPDRALTGEWLVLPAAELPVVVAVRIALSFPLLVSAVPLGAVDYEPKARCERRVRTCWMSDGGLCTNFPIHLFDSLVPRWPTFGISVRPRGPHHPRVWLPEHHDQGRADARDRGMDEDSRSGLGRLWGFVLAGAKSAWGWHDRGNERLPGVRDRVVRVFLEPHEGGVNLKMGPSQLLALAELGEQAADALLSRFADDGAVGWNEHRWVRLLRLLQALEAAVPGLSAALHHAPHGKSLRELLNEALSDEPARGLGTLSKARARHLLRLLQDLEALEIAIARHGGSPNVLRPAVALHVRSAD